MNHLLKSLLPAGCLLALTTRAQTVLPITTSDFALVLSIGADQKVHTVYAGAALADTADYRKLGVRNERTESYDSPYTPSGTWNLLQPAVSIVHSDGDRSLELLYASSTMVQTDPNSTLTRIILEDPAHALKVRLCYRAWWKENVIEQWTEIENREAGPVVLEKYASANLYLSRGRFYLTNFTGDYAREMQPAENALVQGTRTVESRLGTRAMIFETSNFILALDHPAAEDEGEVLLGQLAWTGNFKLDFEVDPSKNLRFIAGIQPDGSAYQLGAGQSFTTPSLIYTYSRRGTGEASRHLQSWARNYRIVDGNGSRLTLLNNWEATFFDFNEPKLASLIHDAKQLGLDLFLLDDGWFGNRHPRDADTAGLGDWQVNQRKLPHGLPFLINEAKKEGVKFGLWIEPEMVNPKSDLYEQHRDWVIRQPARPEIYYRNQLVLDLSNPEVQDFVYRLVDTLLSNHPGLAFIKWDCNAVIYNAYSEYLHRTGQPQTHLYVDYVRGLYRVLERLRRQHPSVPMMLCSGGGVRADYEILKYFTEFWPSDNTEPIERIHIQWANTYFFPALTSDNHVTNSGRQPMKFRVDVACMGKLGFDIVPSKLSAADRQFCTEAIAGYRRFSDLVWHGDQYRLLSPMEHDIASLMYVKPDKSGAVLFTYLVDPYDRHSVRGRPIALKGLDASKQYTVREVNLYPGTTSPIDNRQTYSGDFLMKVGIDPVIHNERSSVVLLIEEKR